MSDRATLELEPADSLRLANLCGQFDAHLKQIESRLGIVLYCRGNLFTFEGNPDTVNLAKKLLQNLYELSEKQVLSPEVVNLHLQESSMDELMSEALPEHPADRGIRTKRGLIRGRGANQKQYIRQISSHPINFGVGPAGTGKTYLAVACAVGALQEDAVQRIVLVRPAVEAGERLGFLPGDMAQKVDPYLRPLYDALYEMLGFERVATLMERNVIEVAPLAFMRGRTLNDAFVILDEAQNTTREQMKMFLTRIGFGSTAVVTGDMTQVDLPDKRHSGLKHALRILANVEGISVTHFSAHDVVRHPIVQRVVEAYDAEESRTNEGE
jgi:phosphate starvation-inducible protein PhoH and related proteins